jgi:hypothetical protein
MTAQRMFGGYHNASFDITLFNADKGYNQLNYLWCSQIMSRYRVVEERRTALLGAHTVARPSAPPLVRNLDNTTSTALFAPPLPAGIIHILNSRRTRCLEMMIGRIDASCRLDNAI